MMLFPIPFVIVCSVLLRIVDDNACTRLYQVYDSKSCDGRISWRRFSACCLILGYWYRSTSAAFTFLRFLFDSNQSRRTCRGSAWSEANRFANVPEDSGGRRHVSQCGKPPYNLWKAHRTATVKHIHTWYISYIRTWYAVYHWPGTRASFRFMPR